MNEAVLKVSSIAIYGFGLLAVFSFLWGSFVFYKKAIESHLEEFHIFDGVVTSAFWAFIVGRLVFVLFNIGTFWNHFPRIFLLSNYPGVDRWGALVGISLGLFLATRKIKAKLLDWFDLVSLGILAGSSTFLAGLFLFTKLPIYLILSLLYFGFFAYFWNIEDKYRTFEWYRAKRTSARSGFVSGFTLSFLGLTYFIEILVLKQSGWITILWSSLLLVGGLVLVYIRSGRTVTEDIKNIFKHGRKQN